LLPFQSISLTVHDGDCGDSNEITLLDNNYHNICHGHAWHCKSMQASDPLQSNMLNKEVFD